MKTKCALWGLLMLLFFSATAYAQEKEGAKVFILMRHAEKEQTLGADPLLSPHGQQQALVLASLLKDQKISAVYATPYRRTEHTAAPLAKEKGVKVMFYDPTKGVALVEKLKTSPATEGATVLIGHSNTIPALVNALYGSQAVEAIAEDEYGQIFIVTLNEQGESSLLRLRLPEGLVKNQ